MEKLQAERASSLPRQVRKRELSEPGMVSM